MIGLKSLWNILSKNKATQTSGFIFLASNGRPYIIVGTLTSTVPYGIVQMGWKDSSTLPQNDRKDQSLPLEGSETATAVLNDSPVGCQTRGVTEPQRDRCRVDTRRMRCSRRRYLSNVIYHTSVFHYYLLMREGAETLPYGLVQTG